MSGVDGEGFTLKTTQEILDEMSEDALTDIAADLDTSSDSPAGQILGILARQNALIWELLQVAYHGYNYKVAENYLLDSLAALKGVLRDPATYSTVTIALNMNSGTTVTPDVFFVNISGQTVRWTPLAAFTAGSTGNHSVPFRAENTGPQVANASASWVIATPLSGVNSIGTNAADADLGAVEQNDTSLRLSIEAANAVQGGSTLDAVRADVLAVDGVQQVFVFENVTNAVVGDLPAHALEVVIWDDSEADDQEVLDTIWASKPAGIQAFGRTVTGTVEDAEGNEHTLGFTRATVKNVYFDVFVTTNSDYPGDGDALVKAALAARAVEIQTLGVDVIAMQYRAAALTVAGVIDVTGLELGYAATPAGTSNLTVSQYEIADVSTTRITVTATPGSL